MLTDGQISYAALEDRGVVSLKGADVRAFLQGLITNNVNRATADHAIWTGFLTPQGKYLFDFFIIEVAGALLLDCEAERIDDLIARLTRYKLRSQVEITDVSGEWAVAALIGGGTDTSALVGFEGRGGPFAGGVCFVDPRYGGGGSRAILPKAALGALEAAGFSRAEAADYDLHRLICGLPDGSRDLLVEKAFPMENGFDQLHGIDWDKGCYVGQEMTARMRYRANAKKMLLPVEVGGALPAPGTAITQDGREVGEMRSGQGGIGLALLRVEALAKLRDGGDGLRAGDTALAPMRPPYLSTPTDAGAGTGAGPEPETTVN